MEEIQNKSQLQPEYKRKDYWNKRYQTKETFYDWYCSYQELKQLFSETYKISKDSKILMVGCGNSQLSEQMYDDGFTNIISTDISDVVIDQLTKDSIKKGKNMIFEIQDCTNLTYEDETFDIVFDKGTLDAISCDNDGEKVVKQMLKEMQRVIKKTGYIIIVSFGSLKERFPYFRENFDFDQYEFNVCEKLLSLESQMTNLMRHHSKGLPLNQVMKDKDILLKVFNDLKVVKKQIQEETLLNKVIDWDEFIENVNNEEGEREGIEQNNQENQNENIQKEKSNFRKQSKCFIYRIYLKKQIH